MKENDVLRRDGATLRVLAIRSDLCFCINCNTACMPAWVPADELEDCIHVATPVIETSMTVQQKQVAHQRFTMIAPLLAFLTDDRERSRMMNHIVEEQGISRQTLRRYLCRYLVYQDIAALDRKSVV